MFYYIILLLLLYSINHLNSRDNWSGVSYMQVGVRAQYPENLNKRSCVFFFFNSPNFWTGEKPWRESREKDLPKDPSRVGSSEDKKRTAHLSLLRVFTTTVTKRRRITLGGFTFEASYAFAFSLIDVAVVWDYAIKAL